MSKKFKVALVSALVGIYLIIPIATAKAADPCIPDTIGVKAFSVHPGQKVGFLSNGTALKQACTTDDLGVINLTYGPRTSSTYSQQFIMSSTKSWKWKDFTYEDLVALMNEAKFTNTIDAQSLLAINFYRFSNGGAKFDAATNNLTLDQSKRMDLGIVLDPTMAGQCHPDKVALANGPATVYKGSFTTQILNGVPMGNPCTEKDPGWLYIGYSVDGKTVSNTYLNYLKDWIWGGGFDYDWFVATLANFSPPVTEAPPAGSTIRMIFWRSTDSGNPPSLDPSTLAPTADFTTTLNPGPAPAQPKSTALTISCVKGKATKKVVGKNPKCPAGYKKK